MLNKNIFKANILLIQSFYLINKHFILLYYILYYFSQFSIWVYNKPKLYIYVFFFQL